MKNILFIATWSCFSFFTSIPSFSQIDSLARADTLKMNQHVNVTMKNGDDFTGTIIKMDKETIELKTANGVM